LIRRIQTKFLWGWGSEGRKIAWVNWKTVCSPVEVGGLGIKDIACFNDALLAKWKWRLGNMGEGLWREILTSKYGDWRNMNENKVQRKQSSWWQDLCRGCGNEQDNWFDSRMQWTLGDGRNVKF